MTLTIVSINLEIKACFKIVQEMQECKKTSETALKLKGRVCIQHRQEYPLWHARTHSGDQRVRTDSAVPCSAHSFKIAFIGTLSPLCIVMNGIHMEHQDFPSGLDLIASFILQATKHTGATHLHPNSSNTSMITCKLV